MLVDFAVVAGVEVVAAGLAVAVVVGVGVLAADVAGAEVVAVLALLVLYLLSTVPSFF